MPIEKKQQISNKEFSYIMEKNAQLYSMKSLVDFDQLVVVAKVSDFDIGFLRAILSQDEIEQMKRYRQIADGKRYVVAHALKRLCLSAFVNKLESELLFAKQEFGKPYCCENGSPFFNLSHSGDWVVIAISSQNEVGVDIDFPRVANHDLVIQRICSKEQVQYYLNAENQETTFLNFWVQKEAISKANGRGISIGMANIASSGETKTETVTLLSSDYSTHTYSWQDGGALAYAQLVSSEVTQHAPHIFRWASIVKTVNSFDCALYEL